MSSISSAAGMMPAPMMSLMVLVASSTVSKTPSSVRYASGLRVMRTQTLRDDAERPLRADDDAGQIVAGVVLGRAAGAHDPAIGQHELDAEDVIDGDAVLERVRPAGVGGHVAADGAGALARRVGGEVVAVRLRWLVSHRLTTPGSTTA